MMGFQTDWAAVSSLAEDTSFFLILEPPERKHTAEQKESYWRQNPELSLSYTSPKLDSGARAEDKEKEIRGAVSLTVESHMGKDNSLSKEALPEIK